MKRKIYILAVVVSLLFCQLVIPAAATDDELVFSMDLSAYDDFQPVIRNAAANGDSSGIAFKGPNNTSGNPKLATYASINGDTRFLSFVDPQNVSTDGRYGSFQIEKDMLKSLGITDSTALSIEWWGNTYADSAGSPLSAFPLKYGTTSADAGSFMAIYLEPSSKAFFVRPSANETADGWWQAAAVSIAADVGSWHHYVWTREWDETSTSWKSYLYRDGDVVSALNGVSGGYRHSEDVSNAAFCVGANYNGYNVYGGGIGTFNIYTKALSASDAQSKYLSTKDNFTEPIKEVLAEENMEDYVVGVSPEQTLLFTQSRGTEGDMSDLTVREKQNNEGTDTVKYIEISNGGASAKDSYYGHRFMPVFSENFVLDVNLQIDGMSPLSRAIRWGKSTIIHDLRNGLSAKTDEFGFFNLRYTFVKGDDGQYDMTCIDLISGETIATKENIGTTCEYILCQQYDTPGNGKYLNVSKFKVYRYTVPEIVSDNMGTLTLDDDTVIVEFSEKLDEATVTESAFVLTNITKNRNVKIGSVSYSADTNVVSFKLREYLDAENLYKLEISGIKDLDGFSIADGTAVEFTMGTDSSYVAEVIFKDSEGGIITALGTEQNIGADVSVYNSSGYTKNYTVFLVLYDAEGTVVDIASGESAGTSSVLIPVELTGNTVVSNGYHAKCYVWENTSDGFKILQEEPAVLN